MPYRILIVDDDADIRDMLTRFLKRRGYVVDNAADGCEALEALRSREPDLMLLDIYMPNMSGLEVLAEIKGEDLRTRTIALSGRPDGKVIEDSLELGAVAFVAKPFDFPDLTAQIADSLLMGSSIG